MDLRLAALLLAVASCGVPGPECEADLDCGGGAVCANTRECYGAGAVHRVVVRWSPAACAGELELSVFDDDSGDFAHYAPVLCSLGVFTFDKLPVHFDRVRLRQLEGGSSGEAAIPADGGEVVVDL